MSVVELLHVSKKIKGAEVVSDVSLTLEKGMVLGIRGINGSGKTMLLRLIAGLIKPSAGSVMIQGEYLGKDRDFPKSIGLLIENPAFLNTYSGFDNLKLLASLQNKVSNFQIQKILSDVGLEQAESKKYKKYSLGMKQRLGIAAAVMESPDLILLDEPTNALDLDGIKMVKKIVKRERARGATVLIACHDQEILSQIADELIYMEAGKITHIEQPRDILP